jgi:NAD(P)-dependent dehydrogenase (short-subunit alcohol dehydrogenase family)
MIRAVELPLRPAPEHLRACLGKPAVRDRQGRRVDISFNAIGIPNAGILGVPLVELDVDQFSQPITTFATSYFLTARLAARRMVAHKSG